MLDLVPLARPGRKVTDRDRETRAIGELLQLPLPEAQARSVAAGRIGGDQERLGLAIGRPAHLLPPPSNRLHGEGRGVVIDADAHPAFVAVQIVDAVRNGLAARRGLDQEVMDAHPLGRLRGAPRTAGILEVPHQFLLLGIHRDRRLLPPLRVTHAPRNVAKLRIPIYMLTAFTRLDVALPAITEAAPQLGNPR